MNRTTGLTWVARAAAWIFIIGIVSTTGPATADTIIFDDPVAYPAPWGPFFIAVGDLDGDDDLDMVVNSHWDEAIAVLLNQGDGTFAPMISYPIGGFCSSLVLGDLDDDGDLDLVASQRALDLVVVLLNDGDATFSPPVSYAIPDWPFGTAVGDLDDDGDLDIAVTNYTGSRITVLWNAGDATFPTSQTCEAGAQPRSIVLGDLDGDDDLDLATAHTYPHCIEVRLNQGGGQFADAVTYPVFNDCLNLAIGDIDGDDDLDLVTTLDVGNWAVVLCDNNGDGTLATPVYVEISNDPNCPALGDLDNDGDLDLAVSDQWMEGVFVLPNPGDGAFSYSEFYSAGLNPHGVALGDFSGDSYLDLALVSHQTDEVYIFMNATGSFNCPGDLNLSGSVDVLDLLLLIARWGDGGGLADINEDGIVDELDLALLIAAWGPCPEPLGACCFYPEGTCQDLTEYQCETAGGIWFSGQDCATFECPPAEMAFIPGGEFEMGRHVGSGGSDELPIHDVYVDSIYVSVYETTNAQYCAYLNSAYVQGLIEVIAGVVYKADDSERYCQTTSATPYSRIVFSDGVFSVTAGKEDHPMVEVTWYGAVAYANWRSTQGGLQPSYDLETWECDWDAGGYRLPTEAEWEYAARGGQHSPYYRHPWGDQIDGSQANYQGSGDPYEGTQPETTPVGYYDGGQTPPGVDMANGYGLYDMAGNVWEWCHDWYDSDYYSTSPYDNPHGPETGADRLQRGGAWNYGGDSARCAVRFPMYPSDTSRNCGFRLALDAY